MVNIMLHLFDLQSRNMYKPCKTCWTRSCCNREKNKIPNIKAKECSRCPRGSNYRLYYIFALNFYNWVETNALDEALAGVARSSVLTLRSGRLNMSCALTDVMIWPKQITTLVCLCQLVSCSYKGNIMGCVFIQVYILHKAHLYTV